MNLRKQLQQNLLQKYPFISGIYFYHNGYVKAQFKNGKEMIRPSIEDLEKSIEFHYEEQLENDII